MQTLLGIDVGTSGVKVILTTAESGEIIADGFVEYPLSTPHPGWAEQEPEEWWQATLKAIRVCLIRATSKEARVEDIKGVGLSGQMQGAVLLDERDEVLRPCIIWCDQRSDAQCRWMIERVGAERMKEQVYNLVMTADVAPKLLWVRENEPEIFARTRTLLIPKDYIRFRLTGKKAIEISDAGGTCLCDERNAAWSQAMLKELDISPDLLPPIVRSYEASGTITPEVANLSGLPADIPVAGGGADNACGAVGNGVIEPGLGLVSVGTSGVVVACADTPLVDTTGPVPRLQTLNHATPDVWFLMGVSQAAGLSLRWVRDNIGQPERIVEQWTGVDAYDNLTKEAEQIAPGSNGLIFLPYLQGERTPHLDAYARGGWIGLTASHDRRHLIRSAVEGVAFALKDSFAIMNDLGLKFREVRITGGGARSAFLRQVIADVLGVELVLTSAPEGPAFGAALLAGVASGIYPSVKDACTQTLHILLTTKPLAENKEIYAQTYATYKDLYPALKPILSHPL